ncbi:hypothetical protein BGX30_006713 [Mortierella sp. GBA39]|nr:hypothetical protein BGX30_006713 [Mortierella sp. GBA39]
MTYDFPNLRATVKKILDIVIDTSQTRTEMALQQVEPQVGTHGASQDFTKDAPMQETTPREVVTTKHATAASAAISPNNNKPRRNPVTITPAAVKDIPPIVVKASLGDTASQVQLGNMYRREDRADQDHPAARYWFRKVADEGDTSGQNGLGDLYRLGLGVTRDPPTALHWYLKAANQGDAIGQCNFGLVYDFGLVGSAAQQGLPKAQFTIGNVYGTGDGVRKDTATAVEWFHKAISCGDGDEWSHFTKGHMCRTGLGVPRNLGKAVEWFENAALHGNSSSQLMLGVIYFYSDAGVPLDCVKALYWTQKVASQGVALALFMVGTIHFKGLGVTKNYTEAIEWFHKAADRRLL